MENVPLTSGHFKAALVRMALEGAACAMARKPETAARTVERMLRKSSRKDYWLGNYPGCEKKSSMSHDTPADISDGSVHHDLYILCS